jgi:hypothetical protein
VGCVAVGDRVAVGDKERLDASVPLDRTLL